jgi:hypothetical protein
LTARVELITFADGGPFVHDVIADFSDSPRWPSQIGAGHKVTCAQAE